MRLGVVGDPGDSYRFWTRQIDHSDADGLFPAWRSPDRTINELIDRVYGSRPDLYIFCVRAEWMIQSSVFDAPFDVASWEIHCPRMLETDTRPSGDYAHFEVIVDDARIHWECRDPMAEESVDEREDAETSEEEEVSSDEGAWSEENESREE